MKYSKIDFTYNIWLKDSLSTSQKKKRKKELDFVLIFINVFNIMNKSTV